MCTFLQLQHSIPGDQVEQFPQNPKAQATLSLHTKSHLTFNSAFRKAKRKKSFLVAAAKEEKQKWNTLFPGTANIWMKP